MLKPKKSIALIVVLLMVLSACSPAAPAAGERLARGAKQGTYYEVFVRAFADSDGDGIGDFAGLAGKMDYFSDMGITGLWLMPVFESPSYHGYDTTDYYKINSDYGTMEDFEAFIAAADERGIAVILDLVVNHSSTRNEWFIQSRDPDSPYRDWYYWSGDGEDINLNASFYGNRVWNQTSSGYYAGLFWGEMPDLNLDNPEVRAEIKRIAEFWLGKGVSGFRLDAAMHVFNSGKLPMGSGLNQEEKSLEWWTEFAEFCRGIDPDCYIVGEIWAASATRAAYTAALDSAFHFDMGETLARTVVRGSDAGNAFAKYMKSEYNRLSGVNPNAIDAPFLSNHDQNRISTMLRNDPENLKMAANIYLTLQGLPFVYYGEELGMIGGKPDENIRTPFLWGADDPALTSWHSTVYNDNVASYAEQSKDSNSLLNRYKALIRLRAATPALFAGTLEPVDSGSDAVMAYTMTAPEQTVLVLHNLSKERRTLELDGSGTVIFGEGRAGANGITLEPQSSLIIER